MAYGVYAYICDACNHRLARHTNRLGHLFQCAYCSCAVGQDAAATGLNLKQYAAWLETHPEPAMPDGET